MNIAIDIDDTLNIVRRAEYAEAYLDRHRELPFRIVDPDANEFVRICDWTLPDVIECMRDGGTNAFRLAEARPDAADVVGGWKRDGYGVTILTARLPEWFGDPVSFSCEWLNEKSIPYDKIEAAVLPADKGAYCAANGVDVLVDDNIASCLGAEAAGVDAILALREGASASGVVRYEAASWRDIDRIVRALAAGGSARR